MEEVSERVYSETVIPEGTLIYINFGITESSPTVLFYDM